MRTRLRGLFGMALALAFVAACGSSDSTSPNVSLAGNYNLTGFTESGNDVSQLASGTLDLTDTHYAINIAFAGGVAPAIIDTGTYTATTNGAFTEESTVNGQQATGTYTLTNNVLTVNVTAQGVPVTQTWTKQ